MPCVYLPGPAPAVTVANSPHRKISVPYLGRRSYFTPSPFEIIHISPHGQNANSCWICTHFAFMWSLLCINTGIVFLPSLFLLFSIFFFFSFIFSFFVSFPFSYLFPQGIGWYPPLPQRGVFSKIETQPKKQKREKAKIWQEGEGRGKKNWSNVCK